MKNREFEIVFFDGYDEVRDVKTHEVIFKTEGMNPKVVDNVVSIWNEHRNISDCLFSGGVVDEYLLNEEACFQEEREDITEALYAYSEK